MDLSAFSKDSFDPKEWINKTFKCEEAQKNKEEYAASVVAKLQLLIQEVNISLETTAEQVIQNIPRIAREVQAMKQEAKLLQEQMNAVRDDVMKVEQDSSKSMHTLLKIDHVKSCMQEACKALREADNWATLSADVDEVFESGDINAISAKLIGMQNSLEILVDVPDYIERCQRLETLKDRLEAIISPQLIAAFNFQTGISDMALVYMKIFQDIKRLRSLQKYYHTFQKNQLLQQWKQIAESDADETFIDWLNNFYDILLSTWHSQMSVCNQLLLDMPAVEVLSELLVDTLVNLEPSLEFCIQAALKSQSLPVNYIIDLKQVTDRLAKSLNVSIQAIDANLLKSAHVVALAQTIYSPYKTHIENYTNLEVKQLTTSLSTITFESEDMSDSIRLLGDSISKVFFYVQEAENRCHLLTHGCGYPAYFRALKQFFQRYLEKFQRALQLLRNVVKDSSKSLGSDWVPFQQCLHMMQTSGEVLLQLERLEQLLKSNVREVGRKLGYYSINNDLDKFKDPFYAYDDILLSPHMKRELQSLISSLQEESSFQPLSETIQRYEKLCHGVGAVIISLVAEQIRSHLLPLPQMKVWNEENETSAITQLPTFSLSPLEYITEIGQYLMTIPQHIEPFILQDNPALYMALKNWRKSLPTDQDSSSTITDYLLESLAHCISDTYLESLLKINSVTSIAIKQLITDIDYFCDVLDDLGITPPSDIQDFALLLKTSAEEFQSTCANKPAKLVNAVKIMRKIR